MFWRRKKRSTGDFAEEIRSHIELEADQLNTGSVTGGVTSAQARVTARKAFGNVTAAEERFYERGRMVWFHDLLRMSATACAPCGKTPASLRRRC